MASMLEVELSGNRKLPMVKTNTENRGPGCSLLQAQWYKQGIKTTTAVSSSTSLVSKSANYLTEEPLLL